MVGLATKKLVNSVRPVHVSESRTSLRGENSGSEGVVHIFGEEPQACGSIINVMRLVISTYITWYVLLIIGKTETWITVWFAYTYGVFPN